MEKAKLKGIFLVEAAEHLQAMTDILSRLKSDPDNRFAIDALFREAHSARGMAETMEYQNVTRLLHLLEDGLDRCRKCGHMSSAEIDRMLLDVDLLESLLEDIRRDLPERDINGLFQSVFYKETKKAISEVCFSTIVADESRDLQVSWQQKSNSVRVRSERLEALTDLSNALSATRQQLLDAHNQPDRQMMDAGLAQLSQLSDNLHHQIHQLRAVTLHPLFGRLSRMVENLARNNGKYILFECTGDDLEVDRAIVERLIDPLIQMIRNSVDHGIKEHGTIHIKVWYEGNQLLVQVADNGVGINPELIRRVARQRGFIKEHEADGLTANELYQLICRAGFSTVERTVGLSGRGVGMDLVKTAVTMAGGVLQIDSCIGQGTSITLKIPLPLPLI